MNAGGGPRTRKDVSPPESSSGVFASFTTPAQRVSKRSRVGVRRGTWPSNYALLTPLLWPPGRPIYLIASLNSKLLGGHSFFDCSQGLRQRPSRLPNPTVCRSRSVVDMVGLETKVFQQSVDSRSPTTNRLWMIDVNGFHENRCASASRSGITDCSQKLLSDAWSPRRDRDLRTSLCMTSSALFRCLLRRSRNVIAENVRRRCLQRSRRLQLPKQRGGFLYGPSDYFNAIRHFDLKAHVADGT